MYDEELPLKERIKASELLGKSEGDFIERHKLEGLENITIEVKAPWETDEVIDAEATEVEALPEGTNESDAHD